YINSPDNMVKHLGSIGITSIEYSDTPPGGIFLTPYHLGFHLYMKMPSYKSNEYYKVSVDARANLYPEAAKIISMQDQPNQLEAFTKCKKYFSDFTKYNKDNLPSEVKDLNDHGYLLCAVPGNETKLRFVQKLPNKK